MKGGLASLIIALLALALVAALIIHLVSRMQVVA